MKRLLFVLVIMLCFLSLVACMGDGSTESSLSTSTNAPQSTTVPNTTEPEATLPEVVVITPEKAKEMIDQGGVIIVDVRRADEYAEGHIEGAILVPNETIETEAPTALPDKHAVYLIYCRSGRRSNEAAHKLIALGYQHVYDFGGILSWEYGTVTN